MATMVRLSRERIEQMFVTMDELENDLKAIHAELIELGVPRETIRRFARLHDRYTSEVTYLKKQRELGRSED